MKDKARLIIEIDKNGLLELMKSGMPGARFWLVKVEGDGLEGGRTLIEMMWNYPKEENG